MSGVTGTSAQIAPAWGLAAELAANSAQVRARMTTLIEQASTGKVGTSFAQLGGGAGTSIRLRPALGHLQTWQSNIDAASTRMQVAQTALAQIGQIASGLRAQATALNGLAGGSIDTLAATARASLAQVAQLLNTQSDGAYVFGGQDSASPPVPAADAIAGSGFATGIAGAVAGLGGAGAAATMAGVLAVAGSNAAGVSPFTAALSQPAATVNAARTTVQAGPGQGVPTGIMAGTNADVPSTGGFTTGSYIRDIMGALAALGGLSSAQAGDPGLVQFGADLGQSLGDAVSALSADAGVMGNRQTALQATKSTLADTATALQQQLSGAEDVDMAATLSQLTATQSQLQASYQLISGLQGLSLAKFLPAGG